MPTNREWLEHTERAAWDTVQSLRRQIEEEKVRILRLTPLRESWQRIIEILDLAKVEHGVAAEHYADVVDALVAELRKAKEDREFLAARLESEQKSAQGLSQRVEVITVERNEPFRKGARVRWFAGRIAALRRERARLLKTNRQPSLERLVIALEAKVEELDGASSDELTRIAVDLGALALSVAEHAELRKKRRSSSSSDEEE
ncbi:MAG TPA: hypothetical protein VHC69_20645 [Polyangiaceae bacterium]|nr:hypothetical protein [Polyangiaceae bacterium]